MKNIYLFLFFGHIVKHWKKYKFSKKNILKFLFFENIATLWNINFVNILINTIALSVLLT